MKNFNPIIIFLKEFFVECRQKHLFILASSSCFFFFLCLIPSTLLLISLLTYLFESITPTQTFTFLGYLESIIPDDIMPTFQFLFKHSKDMLLANKNINFIHYIILGLSSLGFFGSVWKSIEIITNIKKHGTFARAFKSFISITLSFGFILLIVSLPLIYKAINLILTSDFLSPLNLQNTFLSQIQSYEFFGINFISTIFIFIFFIFFFRFLLHGNVNIKSTIVGSAFFTLCMVSMKFLFFTYLTIVKQNLIMNYGSLYSFMIFVLWIFTVILAFYMAIVFTFTLGKHWYRIQSIK